jgi:hypothetical protein
MPAAIRQRRARRHGEAALLEQEHAAQFNEESFHARRFKLRHS